MKILLFLFATLFALSHKDLVSTKDLLSSKNRKCKIKCSGETDEFTQYAQNILSLEGLFGESSRIKTFSFLLYTDSHVTCRYLHVTCRGKCSTTKDRTVRHVQVTFNLTDIFS